MPLWGVEVVYQQVNYGRVGSVVASVAVQSQEQPQVSAMGPVGFDELRVEVRVIRTTGVLVENWTAERVSPAQPAARRAGTASSSEAA